MYGQLTMYSLSFKVIVPSKSVKKMYFGLPFMKGSSEAETILLTVANALMVDVQNERDYEDNPRMRI